MSLEILVSREASADIVEAISEFGDISSTLSERFKEELERVYSYIGEYPEIYPTVYRNFRRGLLRRFPYSVFYIVEKSFVVVVGVVHQSRDESTWKRRA